MAVHRTAKAVWELDLLKGHGRVAGISGGLPETAVSWAARTEGSGGKTSPEELLAAAHASCYSMALSGTLGRAGTPPERLQVTADATFDKVADAWTVTTMKLSVVGKVPNSTQAKFEEAAKIASETCPISRALKGNVQIEHEARLE
ncbi:MAG: OsmC family peroxiredoxin [Thermoplasmata archaeon]|nr:OsmC family peroxiredoxin [Thermoplasmata archaeon]